MAAPARRSANYQPSIWDDDYIQSLTTSYMQEEKYADDAEKLKKKVKIMIDESRDELEQLELIDNLQRLGICNYFRDEIAKMVAKIYDHEVEEEKELHATALKFRILRQHGYHVSQEVFGDFLENLKGEDVRGLVSLHEASYLSMEGESIMDLAKDLSRDQLRVRVKEGCGGVAEHSLELPLQWRVQRLEARWFVQEYESRSDASPVLVELAKLNFNMVQAKCQAELKRLSSWYKESGLPEKLRFARHRLAECFLWAVGFIPDGEQGHAREILTKSAVLITIMDDLYDVYGTLEELQLFTEALERWDINSLERLPEYMRVCFLAVFNTANEFAYRIMRDDQGGFNAISNLKRLWAELGRAYYLEARWFASGYTPTTDEYLNTAWVSISGPLLLLYAYLCTTNPINKDELQRLEGYPPIINHPSLILRLADDLGTSSEEIKRGDVPKSVQCFIKETECSEEDARQHVQHLIQATLKKMNKHIMMEENNNPFTAFALNLARISLCFYKHGDGFGLPHSHTKINLTDLIARPIPLSPSLCHE